MNPTRILIIDDEPKIRRLLAANLSSLAYETTMAADGAEGLRAFDATQPALVLLDLMMPGVDGFQVLERLRAHSTVPVIVLTARDQTEDKVRAFDLGADDYLAKPFALEELFVRVRAVLRRASPSAEPAERSIANGALRIDLGQHRAWLNDEELKLTATEFRLLATLMRRVGAVMTHEHLLASVWGPEYVSELQYLRVALARVRQKLRDAGLQEACIKTYSGAGYLMERLPDQTSAPS